MVEFQPECKFVALTKQSRCGGRMVAVGGVGRVGAVAGWAQWRSGSSGGQGGRVGVVVG